MNKEEIIKSIKDLLTFNKESDVTLEETVINEFLDVTDVDGNVLRIDSEELAVGGVLKIVTEEGEDLTPDAEYTLEDGRVIKTDAESVIIEVIEAEEEEVDAEEEEEVIEEEMAEEVAEVTDETVVDEISNDEEEVVEEEGTNLESRIDQLESIIKEMIANQSKLQEASMSLVTMVEKFGETPVEDIEDVKSTFSSIKEENKSSLDERLNSFRSIRTNKNNK